DLVRTQNRAILDSELPLELTREIAQRCDTLFCYSSETGLIRRLMPNLKPESGMVILTALDVHDRFGGSAIEKVLEHSSASVPKHSMNSPIVSTPPGKPWWLVGLIRGGVLGVIGGLGYYIWRIVTYAEPPGGDDVGPMTGPILPLIIALFALIPMCIGFWIGAFVGLVVSGV